jgi:hypothetical protein
VTRTCTNIDYVVPLRIRHALLDVQQVFHHFHIRFFVWLSNVEEKHIVGSECAQATRPLALLPQISRCALPETARSRIHMRRSTHPHQ